MRISVERRISELEQRREARERRTTFITIDADQPPEEHERLRAAAEAEVGPDGLVVEIHCPSQRLPERGQGGSAEH
jgi:hypothetical protein